MRFSSRIKISIFFGLSGTCLVGSTFKDTTTIIQEWVQTEQLIGEESSEWNIEKAALLDVRGALENEISELTKRLEESEEEAVGAAQQRTELLEQKAEIEETTLSLLDGIDTLEAQVEEAFALLPPLLPNGCSHFVTNSNPESSKVIYPSGNESTPCYHCCKRFPCSTGT